MDFEKSGKSQRLLAEQFGVGKTQIQQTIKRKAEYMTAYEENTHSSRKRLCTHFKQWWFRDNSLDVVQSGTLQAHTSGADPGGGGPGVKGPPLVPREGVLDPSSKMKKTAFIIFSFI